MPRCIQGFADRADATIHHVRGRDDVAPGVGLIDCLPTECFHAFVIDYITAEDKPVLAVSRIWIERDVSDQSDWNLSVAHSTYCLADQVVRIAGFFAVGRFLFLRSDGKNGYRRDTQFCRSANQADEHIDRIPCHAGHGDDRHFLI